MDTLKTYLIEVVWKKMGPSLIKGAIASVVGIMLAHQGVLDSLGISYDKPGNTIDINLTALSVWMTALMTGGLTAIFTALQHHTVAAVKDQPQDGAHQRVSDPSPLVPK